MNFSYNKNFFVVSFNLSDEIINYQAETIINNVISFLAPCKKQIKNDIIYFYYNITSAISLKDAVSTNKMSFEQFLNFIEIYLQLCIDLEKYLLPSSGIITKLEHIYINPADFKPYFIFIPSSKKNLDILDIKNFIKLLLVSNIYDINSNNSIQEIIDILDEDLISISDLMSKINMLKKSFSKSIDFSEFKNDSPDDFTDEIEVLPKINTYSIFDKDKLMIILLDAFSIIIPTILIFFEIIPIYTAFAIPVLLILINLIFNIIKNNGDLKHNEKFEPEVIISNNNYTSVPENNATELIKILPYIRNTHGDIRYIDSNFLRIGKLSEKVDYCVNNPSISKIHADILIRDKKMFVIDLNSKNGTFINDISQRLESNIEYELKNGDKLILANEEFTVHFYDL